MRRRRSPLIATTGRGPLRGSAGLGIGQLFALIFGFLVTSVLIFVFGIWVGRDIAERRLAQEERVVRLPVPAQPAAAATPENPNVDLAFYERLKEQAMQRLQQTAAAPSPTAAGGAQAGARTPPPRRRTERVHAARRPPTPPRRAPALAASDQSSGAAWTVQVNATTSLPQAIGLAQRLRAKGYNAYTVQAPMHGQTWYRVRVGRFASRDKARDVEARLKSREGLENAYVTPE